MQIVFTTLKKNVLGVKAIIMHILYAFKRDALFIGITIFVVCCSCFSIFLGSNAVIEANIAKIVYTAGFSRIIIIIGFIIFVSFYIKRMIENQEICMVLSHSISRSKIILAMFFGFSVVLFFLIVPLAGILFFLNINFLSTLLWLLSVFCEGIVMLAFALCCSLIIKSFVHSILGCLFMYVAGRTIGNLIPYISFSSSVFSIENFFGNILKILSIFIPRFDLFGKTSWLVYNDISLQDIFVFIAQTTIFCLIFFILSVLDFRKKQF